MVPLPINFPELYRYYVPMDATFFLTIYDEWGERETPAFESLGLKVEESYEPQASIKKGLTASAIRPMMGLGQPWEHLVPAAVGRVVGNGPPATLRNHGRLNSGPNAAGQGSSAQKVKWHWRGVFHQESAAGYGRVGLDQPPCQDQQVCGIGGCMSKKSRVAHHHFHHLIYYRGQCG